MTDAERYSRAYVWGGDTYRCVKCNQPLGCRHLANCEVEFITDEDVAESQTPRPEIER